VNRMPAEAVKQDGLLLDARAKNPQKVTKETKPCAGRRPMTFVSFVGFCAGAECLAVYVSVERPKLSEREAHGLRIQMRGTGALRCSAWWRQSHSFSATNTIKLAAGINSTCASNVPANRLPTNQTIVRLKLGSSSLPSTTSSVITDN
jgi:hypothetical protein